MAERARKNILTEFGLDRDTSKKIDMIRRDNFYRTRIIPFEQLFLETQKIHHDRIMNLLTICGIPNIVSEAVHAAAREIMENHGYYPSDSDDGQ